MVVQEALIQDSAEAFTHPEWFPMERALHLVLENIQDLEVEGGVGSITCM
jgi:hypothetical protein